MVVDVNAWIGHWPFRRLPASDAAGLSAAMQRTAVDRALVSPLSAPTYRDPMSAVEEMLDDPGWDAARMTPLAVVNPLYPGWEWQLERQVRELGCVGVRLLPNYHNYRLYEPVAAELAQAVAEAGVPLVITLRMYDERSHHPRMTVPAVSLDEVRFLMRLVPQARYVISHCNRPEAMALVPDLVNTADGGCELSYKPQPFAVERAVESATVDRVLYGSGAMLQYMDSLLLPVREAQVDEVVREVVLSGNAMRIFGLGDGR